MCIRWDIENGLPASSTIDILKEKITTYKKIIMKMTKSDKLFYIVWAWTTINYFLKQKLNKIHRNTNGITNMILINSCS